MRSARLLVALFIIATFVLMPSSSAQPANAHYIILYAHSDARSPILNALPQWGGQKSGDISKGLAFKLTPTLGTSLKIQGTITTTLWLRGNQPLFGTVFVEVTELKSTGEEIPVVGRASRVPAKMESPVLLDTLPLPFTLGVGIIDYEFAPGSSILLHIRLETQTPGVPSLVWDDPNTSTNLTIPAVSPLRAQIASFIGETRQGRVVRVDPTTGHIGVSFLANITDAIGIYRLSDTLLTVTAPNGTDRIIKQSPKRVSDYVAINSFAITLNSGPWRISLEVRDLAGGERYGFTDTIWVAPFYTVRVNVADSSGVALQDAIVNVAFGQEGNWTEFTNSTGWATMVLPSSVVLGPLNVTIVWHGVPTQSSLSVVGESTIVLKLPIYDVDFHVLMDGIPLPGATVKLLNGGQVIAQATSGLDGTASLKRIPAANYTLVIQYLFNEFRTQLDVKDKGPVAVGVPTPYRRELLIMALVAVGAVTLSVVQRKRTKLYPQAFSYFDKLTTGGLPQTCFALIAGDSGSGKTVLLETLAARHLKLGQCVFITNTEYPTRIRENMATLRLWDTGRPDNGKIRFIDAYSAVGGASSNEEIYVTSHTDLTDLGLKISKCLERSGQGTDVYLDSLNPLLSALRIEYLLNFLQSIASKVKANDGKLCVTVGTGIQKSDMVKLEEAADCVIETQLQELKRGQKRRLRIKKLRGKPYIDKWTNFQIETERGITFYSRTKS